MIHEMLIIVSQGDLSGTKIDQRFETEKTLLEVSAGGAGVTMGHQGLPGKFGNDKSTLNIYIYCTVLGFLGFALSNRISNINLILAST